MREIKFRIWNGKDSFCTDGYVKANLFNELEHNRERVSQYTGLKDKNGKDIYEGDIVRYATEMTDKGNILKNYRVAEVTNNDPYAYSPWYGGFVIEPEVIGNIYQNKELLV